MLCVCVCVFFSLAVKTKSAAESAYIAWVGAIFDATRRAKKVLNLLAIKMNVRTVRGGEGGERGEPAV